MFPKFLKVTAFMGERIPVWINETHFIKKFYLNNLDQSILDMYAQALGFSYEIVSPPEDGISFRLPNGSWTGIMGLLQRGEVDMVVSDTVFQSELNEDFRIGYPNFLHEITFATKNPEQVTHKTLFLHPFSIPVWLSIVACIFLLPFLFYNIFRRKHSIVSLIASTLGSLVGQAIGVTPQRRRDYFVLASWILSSALLYHFYAAVLLSFLTLPSLHGVRTIDELAEGIKDGQYQCSSHPGTNIHLLLREFEDSAARVIGNNIEYCYKYRIMDCVETSAGDTKRAFVCIRSFLFPYKDFYFISEENFYSIISGIVMHKHFCCGSELDRVVHRAWASGIFQRIFRMNIDYTFVMDLKNTVKYWSKPPEEGKLTMAMLKGPFIFLIASLSLAFLVFLIEVFTGRFKTVPRYAVLVSKVKIRNHHRPRATKRKKVAIQKLSFNRHSDRQLSRSVKYWKTHPI